nr:hypothetical protein Iba_chr06aCG8970 [Ipomoea batatas]
MPTGDHQSYPPLLPTQNVLTNNEILISPLQIERLDSQLEANILEEGTKNQGYSYCYPDVYIEKLYSNKVQAKLAGSKEKLPVMEEREASTIQHDENAITQGEVVVEACVINEAQVEVPAENLVEEPVEVETAAEFEEQVMIPNVTNTENISISVTFPVEVICEGVVTSQDETLMKTNLDESQHENATNVPTVTQSHEMDVTENLSNTLEDTNENLYENLIDAQAKLAGSKEKLPVMEESFYALSVEDFEELDQANFQEGFQRSIVNFHYFPGEASTIQHDENTMTQGEGPLNANEREIQILNEACVTNEAQVEVPADNLVEELVEVETAAEVEEQVMIPNDETLVETNLDESQHGNATNVPTVTQSHEMDVTENLSNTLEDTNENLFENLIDAQGEESSHLALGTFIPVDSNVGRGKGKGIFRFLGFASKDPRPKFGAIQYFSDDRIAPYTMEDVPAIMRKHAE